MDYKETIDCLLDVYNSGYTNEHPKMILTGFIAKKLKTLEVYKINAIIKGLLSTGLIKEGSNKNVFKFTEKSYYEMGKENPFESKEIKLNKEESDLLK